VTTARVFPAADFLRVSGFTAKQQRRLPGPWPGRSACGKRVREAREGREALIGPWCVALKI
jgi:hypothetical protein